MKIIDVKAVAAFITNLLRKLFGYRYLSGGQAKKNPAAAQDLIGD